jgi:hypothetical protein
VFVVVCLYMCVCVSWHQLESRMWWRIFGAKKRGGGGEGFVC